MQARIGPGAEDAPLDVETLQRGIGDVAGLSALAAVWATATPPTIATSLAQVLQETLNADLVCVGLRATARSRFCDAACRTTRADDSVCDSIRSDIARWLAGPADDSGFTVRDRAHLATPIGLAGEHGLIVTICSRAGFPTSVDRLLLNVAANQATLALLAGSAREEQRIADTLQRVGQAVAAELDPEKLVQTVTDELTALTGADFGAFFYNVVNQAGESYMLYTLAGAPRDAFSRFPMPRNTAIFGPTFAGEGVVRLGDVTADPRFGRNAPYHGMPPGHLPVRSYLAVPVISRTGRVHGGLFLGHKDVEVFTERHERLAVGIAAAAALGMDNADLFARAQGANMAKDQFLATLSHELRTPLNAIVGWLSMLRRPEVMTTAGVPKAWAAIDRNTEALVGLIEDLLDVSRIATGKLRLAETDVDVADVMQDIVATVRPRFIEANVELGVDGCRPGCVVRGDVARLRQVVMNLVTNAVKFTARGGRVRVRLQCDESSAVLTVSDTGIGIHPDFLPHIFERFRQQDANATSGLGLGLAIVKNLVELHGGMVTAASDGVGRGARFTVTLPRRPPPPD